MAVFLVSVLIGSIAAILYQRTNFNSLTRVLEWNPWLGAKLLYPLRAKIYGLTQYS